VRRTEGFAGTTSTAASSTAAPLDQAETAAARARLADTLIGRQALLIVDTNEQVARLSAQLHADLGRLGRIDDQASVEPFVERSGVI
jgi:hypothetical protein